MTTTFNLTHEPETVDFPATHYVFIERIGNIPANAPQAWHTVEKFAAALMQQNQITGAAAFYKPARESTAPDSCSRLRQPIFLSNSPTKK